MLQGRGLRAAILAPLLVAALLALGTPGARAQEAIAVRNIEVDVSAASAAEARDLAIAEAQRKAFAELYRRLTGGTAEPPELGDEDLFRLVRDFEIQQEKTSATRYLGLITVRFRPELVRDLLLASGESFVAIPSKPVLVLPVFGEGEDAILWEDRTPWRDAWENAVPGGGLLTLVVPPGELPDIADVSVEEALAGDEAALARIAERYGAGEVAVAQFRPVDPEAPEAGAEVTLARRTAGGRVVREAADVPGTGAADLAALAQRAVDASIRRLDELWTQENQVAGGEPARLVAHVPLAGPGDWEQIRRRLAEVPLVDRAVLRALSRDRAEVELNYRGTVDRLLQALADRGLELAEGAPDRATGVPNNSGVAGAGWLLRRTSAP